jgi:hypothetical protein
MRVAPWGSGWAAAEDNGRGIAVSVLRSDDIYHKTQSVFNSQDQTLQNDSIIKSIAWLGEKTCTGKHRYVPGMPYNV